MKITRTLLPIVAMALVSFTPSIRVNAQTNAHPPAAANGNRQGGRGGSVETQLNRLAEELKLTDDQKHKVKGILEADAKKRQELQNDTALSQEERRSKRQAMREEMGKKMKEVLNAEQYKHYEELQRQRRNQNQNQNQTP